MWSLAAPGASCGASRCAAGVRTEPACDEAGECRDVSTTCPTGICRDDASCATCVVDDECSTAEYCTGTECVATGPIGTTCDRDRQCASGVCADGVCCDRQCEGGCESCAASTVGVCTPYVEGTDPESACGMSTCDGRGACTADAGVDADAGEAGLEAHGSGCVSCAVGARRRSPAVAVLFLTLFVAVRARRRRR
jgi:hypothetical protein